MEDRRKGFPAVLRRTNLAALRIGRKYFFAVLRKKYLRPSSCGDTGRPHSLSHGPVIPHLRIVLPPVHHSLSHPAGDTIRFLPAQSLEKNLDRKRLFFSSVVHIK